MTYTEKIEYIVGNSKFDTKPDEPYNKNICQFTNRSLFWVESSKKIGFEKNRRHIY